MVCAALAAGRDAGDAPCRDQELRELAEEYIRAQRGCSKSKGDFCLFNYEVGQVLNLNVTGRCIPIS